MNAIVHSVDLVLLQGAAFAAAREDVVPLMMRMGDLDRTQTEVSLTNAILDGSMQFWLIRRSGSHATLGAWITEVREYPRGRALIFHCCVGKHFRSWMHLREQIYDWARDLGCIRVITTARRGFGRVLPEAQEILRVYEATL